MPPVVELLTCGDRTHTLVRGLHVEGKCGNKDDTFTPLHPTTYDPVLVTDDALVLLHLSPLAYHLSSSYYNNP